MTALSTDCLALLWLAGAAPHAGVGSDLVGYYRKPRRSAAGLPDDQHIAQKHRAIGRH
jgi:hypothetical protein